MTILFVQDLKETRDLFEQLFECQPVLDVPGMTEFNIMGSSIGIMPKTGIYRILNLPHNHSFSSSDITAELYFRVNEPEVFIEKGLKLGLELMSELQLRNWGEKVGYLKDQNGIILAFADNQSNL